MGVPPEPHNYLHGWLQNTSAGGSGGGQPRGRCWYFWYELQSASMNDGMRPAAMYTRAATTGRG